MKRLALLTEPRGNLKLRKTLESTGVAVYSLLLAHARTSGVTDVCAGASAGCVAYCVGAKNNGMSRWRGRIFAARVDRTEYLVADPAGFRAQLIRELESAALRHYRRGQRVAFRLNCFSDLPWYTDPIIRPALESLYGRFGARSYDYTAIAGRYRAWLAERPPWCHLCFSRKEHTPLGQIRSMVDAGGNVAVAFRTAPPRGAVWHGMKCVDGDASDLRYTDPPGVVVALKAKGSARHDMSGFVVDHPWGTSPALKDRSGLTRRVQSEIARGEFDRRAQLIDRRDSRAELLPATLAILRYSMDPTS